jgi:tripartite ATP-independent transporter DctP family solute receptor
MNMAFAGARSRVPGLIAVASLVLAACSSSASPAPSASAVVSAPGSSTSAPQTPASQPEFVLVAGGTGNLGGPTDEIYTGFVNAVAELSGGRLKIEFHPGGELGGERELLEQVQQGTVDMSLASDSPYSIFDPKWSVMSLPYVFASRDEVYAFLDGSGGKALADAMLAKGVRILAYGENGFRQVSNSKHPVSSIDDLKGLKMRVTESPPLKDWFESIGAIPAVIPFPELYPALQQGIVDGQDNGMINATLLKFYEVQKYWTDTNHVYSSIPIAINESKWQQLPADLQQALLQAAQRQAKAEREALVTQEAAAIESIKSNGGEVVLLTDQERARFVESAKPIWQKYADKVGTDFMDQTFVALGRNWR